MRQGQVAATGRFRWQGTFAALKYPNYRLWFYGQLVALSGAWMKMTAQGFLIYELTQSPRYLGYISFAAGAPTWALTLYGGVVADRVPRRTLLLISQVYLMVLAFVLAGLTFLGRVQPWHIVLLAAGVGVAQAFEGPARQAFVLELVEREDLTNAIALNSTMFNAATAIGPAVAGVVYALFGPAWCFAINGVTYVAIIIALLLIKLEPQPRPARRNSALSDLQEGLRYVGAEPAIRGLIALIALIGFFGFSFVTLMPAWAVRVLDGDARTNGLLQSARGVGALISALTIASLGRFSFKGRLLTVGTFAFPLALLVFSTIRWQPLALLAMVVVGSGLMLCMNLTNILLQSQVSDGLRGRVMGIYTLVLFGFMPVGGLLAGNMAQHIGEPPTLVLWALLTLGGAVLVRAFLPRLYALQ